MIVGRSDKAQLPLLAGFVLLMVCASSAMWWSWQQRSAEQWVRHTLEVEDRLSAIEILTLRADINRRGYLLTGAERNVRSYALARRQVIPQMNQLVLFVSDNPPQARRGQLLRTSILAKLDEMQRSIDLARQGRLGAAVRIIGSAEGLARTTRLLFYVKAMRGDEVRLLAQRRARSDRLEAFAAMSLVLSALLIVTLALIVGRERRLRLLALSGVNDALERDIAERKVLGEELTAARERAEAAVVAKSSFLANMSHEIRTPMNGVVGFTELLLAGELGDQQRRQAELIAESGRAMMRLLNDILDFSKIEAGQMRIAREPFDLAHALRACAKLLSPAIVQRGLDFRCEVDPALPKRVIGDGLRVRQIVLNLLGNASKFTSAGEIVLRATFVTGPAGPFVRIEVEDTGIGIAPDRIAAIFEDFVQADEGTTARFGGTGLGLAISQQLTRLMHGDLTVESTIDVGSRFVLTLPLTVYEDAPAPAAADVAGIGAQPAEPGASPAAHARILVAEDHDVNQLLIAAMLDRLGYRHDLARDGGEAVAMVAAAERAGDRYAAVLMDLQMPEVDGFEATRRIRDGGYTREALPILALTANAYAEDIAACLASGMQAHLAKPVKLPELDDALRRWTAAAVPVETPGVAGRFSPRLQALYAARRREMLLMVDDMVRAGSFTAAEMGDLADVLHKFAGSAGLFGDGALGQVARQLEEGLAVWTDEELPEQLPRAAEAIRNAA